MKTEKKNEETFMEMLNQVRPDLWAFEVYRQELGIDDFEWIKSVLRGVGFILKGTGYGDVTIKIRKHKVYMVFNREQDQRFFLDKG